MMKLNEIRELSTDELNEKVYELKQELLSLFLLLFWNL